MRPGSSTSLSRGVALAGLLVLAGVAVRAGAVSTFGVCLPPAFDRGERLQEVGAMRLPHLELAFRQHLVCREPLPDSPLPGLRGRRVLAIERRFPTENPRIRFHRHPIFDRLEPALGA